MTTSFVKKDIDMLLIACGSVVGFAIPVAMMSRIGDRERTGLKLLNIFSEHPFLSVPAVIFGIAGFTLVSVGLNGLRGKYADVAERFDGIYTTAATTSIVCTGAICILLALSNIVAFIEYRDFRVLATIIGALVGIQLAGYVDGNENTPAAFAFAGGLMGYCAAPALLLFLGVAALLLFGGPLLTILLNHAAEAVCLWAAVPRTVIKSRFRICGPRSISFETRAWPRISFKKKLTSSVCKSQTLEVRHDSGK